MPDAIIERVNKIGAKQKQGRTLAFVNRKKEVFPWADEVPEDDSEFQGLLDDELSFPDISAKLPGVELESDLPTKAVEDIIEPSDNERADAA